MTEYIKHIIELSLCFIRYDPLYADDGDSQGGDMPIDQVANSSSGEPARDTNSWESGNAGSGWGDSCGWDASGAPSEAESSWNAAPTAMLSSDDDIRLAPIVFLIARLSDERSVVSWRIRRSAVGVLSAFIRVRSDILKPFYESV